MGTMKSGVGLHMVAWSALVLALLAAVASVVALSKTVSATSMVPDSEELAGLVYKRVLRYYSIERILPLQTARGPRLNVSVVRSDEALRAVIRETLAEEKLKEINAIKGHIFRAYGDLDVQCNKNPKTWHELLMPLVKFMTSTSGMVDETAPPSRTK